MKIRKISLMLILFILLCISCISFSQINLTYQVPPKGIVEIADAKPTPNISPENHCFICIGKSLNGWINL